VYTGEKRVRINLRDTYFAASLHHLLAVRLAPYLLLNRFLLTASY
jgi:hypothetical protein